MVQSPWKANSLIHIVKKLSSLCRAGTLIIVVIRTSHWPLSQTRWIQSTHSQLISVRCILILSSHLYWGLSFNLSYLPFLFSPIHAMCIALIIHYLDHHHKTWWWIQFAKLFIMHFRFFYQQEKYYCNWSWKM